MMVGEKPSRATQLCTPAGKAPWCYELSVLKQFIAIVAIIITVLLLFIPGLNGQTVVQSFALVLCSIFVFAPPNLCAFGSAHISTAVPVLPASLRVVDLFKRPPPLSR
jgi:hypothetical protein